jgi:hypothetical protein
MYLLLLLPLQLAIGEIHSLYCVGMTSHCSAYHFSNASQSFGSVMEGLAVSCRWKTTKNLCCKTGFSSFGVRNLLLQQYCCSLLVAVTSLHLVSPWISRASHLHGPTNTLKKNITIFIFSKIIYFFLKLKSVSPHPHHGPANTQTNGEPHKCNVQSSQFRCCV